VYENRSALSAPPGGRWSRCGCYAPDSLPGSPVIDAVPRLFFVHIQKTAGGTLRQNILANLSPREVYPTGGPDRREGDEPMGLYWGIDRLVSLSPERRQEIRAYVGHFPYIASELLDLDLVTVTVLRDPVERTISYLKMRSEAPERRGMSIEQIYDDPFDFPCFIKDHQTKIFAMTRDDKLETFMDVIEVDRARLEIAKQNLQKTDIVGLQERYDEVLDAVGRRFGWTMGHVENTHVSKGEWTVSDALRARIAEDNQLDIEFYEFAQKLHSERAVR
jgi:hypothetical protein